MITFKVSEGYKGLCTVCSREATVQRFMKFNPPSPFGMTGVKVFVCDKHTDRYLPVTEAEVKG